MGGKTCVGCEEGGGGAVIMTWWTSKAPEGSRRLAQRRGLDVEDVQ